MDDAGGRRWVATIPLAELRRRAKACVDVEGRAVALFLVDDAVVALDDACVHQGRSLSRGMVLRGQVVCPGHGRAYDPRTGRPARGGEHQPVHDVRVVDGVIHVDPEPRP